MNIHTEEGTETQNMRTRRCAQNREQEHQNREQKHRTCALEDVHRTGNKNTRTENRNTEHAH